MPSGFTNDNRQGLGGDKPRRYAGGSLSQRTCPFEAIYQSMVGCCG